MVKIIKLIVLMIGAGTAVLGWAQSQYADWSTGPIPGGTGFFAVTMNDSGGMLGEYCYTAGASCVYLLAFSTGCEPGSQYPVLVNSDIGAQYLEVHCDGPLPTVAGFYRYVFTDFSAIDKIVKGAIRVGFAFPLKGDEFRVIRFSLNGSNEAIAAMRAVAAMQNSTAKPPASRSTRDESL